MSNRVSTCCGSAPVNYPGPNDDPCDSDSEDHGICPECGDACTYAELKPDPDCKGCKGTGVVYEIVATKYIDVRKPVDCLCIDFRED